MPDDEYQLWWIAQYLAAYQNRTSVPQQEVLEFHRSVRLMAPLSHLLWGAWSLMQAELSKIDFDFIEYAKLRLDQYFLLKNQLK